MPISSPYTSHARGSLERWVTASGWRFGLGSWENKKDSATFIAREFDEKDRALYHSERRVLEGVWLTPAPSRSCRGTAATTADDDDRGWLPCRSRSGLIRNVSSAHSIRRSTPDTRAQAHDRTSFNIGRINQVSRNLTDGNWPVQTLMASWHRTRSSQFNKSSAYHRRDSAVSGRICSGRRVPHATARWVAVSFAHVEEPGGSWQGAICWHCDTIRRGWRWL